MAEYAVMPKADYMDACDAVREKTGGTAAIKSGEMGGLIRSITTGITPVEEKDVNFYDYDGTLLYSYTLAEAQALTELPPAPTPKEDFLVFREWNWTLEEVQALTWGMDIGALYDTVDGKTWLFIDLAVPAQLTQELHFSQTSANIVEVDWGDGSPVGTIGGTGQVVMSHTYSALGEYVIKIAAPSAKCTLGANSTSSNIFGTNNSTTGHNRQTLKKLYMADEMYISQYCFNCCSALEKATILCEVKTRAFAECCALRCVVLPRMAYPNAAWAFANCYGLRTACTNGNAESTTGSSLRSCVSLKRRMLPKTCRTGQSYDLYNCTGLQEASGSGGVPYTCAGCNSLRRYYFSDNTTSIQESFFQNCRALCEIDIPAAVTSIAANAFSNCYSLLRLRFNSVTPPTVANANAFSGLNPNCVVEVPAGSLATYQAATNYASIVAQMVEV